MFRGEWVPIETVTANIPVRGRSQPLPFEVWKTPNGPIFADVGLDWEAPPSWLSPDGRPADERRAIRCAGMPAAISPPRSRRSTAPRLDFVHRPRSESFAAPSLNIVYADVDGNVGYAMSGRLPVRASGDGTCRAMATAAPGGADRSSLARCRECSIRLRGNLLRPTTKSIAASAG